MGEGREKTAGVTAHEQWKAARFGQQEVARSELVATLKGLLASHKQE
jgi:hypothetical protein